MENIRKHKIVRFINKWCLTYGAKDLIADPTIHNRIFYENLISTELSKTEIMFNKTLYIGKFLKSVFTTFNIIL